MWVWSPKFRTPDSWGIIEVFTRRLTRQGRQKPSYLTSVWVSISPLFRRGVGSGVRILTHSYSHRGSTLHFEFKIDTNPLERMFILNSLIYTFVKENIKITWSLFSTNGYIGNRGWVNVSLDERMYTDGTCVWTHGTFSQLLTTTTSVSKFGPSLPIRPWNTTVNNRKTGTCLTDRRNSTRKIDIFPFVVLFLVKCRITGLKWRRSHQVEPDVSLEGLTKGT